MREAARTAGEVMSRSVYTLTEDTDATAAARRSDDDIRAELERRLKEEIEALQRLDVDVSGGVVTVTLGAGPLARQLLEALAHTVPGVVEVRSRQPAPDDVRPGQPADQAPESGRS